MYYFDAIPMLYGEGSVTNRKLINTKFGAQTDICTKASSLHHKTEWANGPNHSKNLTDSYQGQITCIWIGGGTR